MSLQLSYREYSHMMVHVFECNADINCIRFSVVFIDMPGCKGIFQYVVPLILKYEFF